MMPRMVDSCVVLMVRPCIRDLHSRVKRSCPRLRCRHPNRSPPSCSQCPQSGKERLKPAPPGPSGTSCPGFRRHALPPFNGVAHDSRRMLSKPLFARPSPKEDSMRIAITLALVLFLACLTVGAQTVDETKVDPDPGKAEVKALVDKVIKDREAFMTAYGKATQEERAELRPPRPDDYAGDFLALGKKYPGTPAACEALAWVVANGRSGKAQDQALATLVANHIEDAALAPICRVTQQAIGSSHARDNPREKPAPLRARPGPLPSRSFSPEVTRRTDRCGGGEDAGSSHRRVCRPRTLHRIPRLRHHRRAS